MPPSAQSSAELEVGQAINSSDLTAFFAAFVPNAKSGDETIDKFVGAPGDDPTATGIEGSLDIQYLMGVAPGVATEFWYFNAQADFCELALPQHKCLQQHV